jgi:hypothetical protein
MLTKYLIMRPELPHETREVHDWPREPGYDRIASLLEEFFPGGRFEQVSVWADFAGGTHYGALDMFVDGEGLIKNLPRNEAATAIYRRAALMGKSRLPAPPSDPEQMSFIAGPAVLFSRRIWF